MSSRSASDSNGELPQNQPEQLPSITELEENEVIRCRNSECHGITWYYTNADKDGMVTLYHEWDQFDPTSRKAYAARMVMDHPDVDTATVSRKHLETLRGELDE